MATSTFYPAVDGGLRRYTGAETWQQAHDATSASNVFDTLANTSCVASYTSLGLITRSFFSFDTSSLPDDAVIDSATLTITGSAAVTGSNGSVQLVASTQASGTALVANDYDNVGTTAFATGINLGSWATGGANVFTLNSSGLAAISATGYTTLALRHSSDLNNSSPGSDNAVPAYFSEQTGTASDPVLSVTYHLGRSTADAWAWSDVGDISGFSGGTIRTYSRATVGDTWAWSDTTAKPTTDRTAGTERTVWAGGTIGTNSAHYAFPFVVASGGNGRLLAVCRKGTSHVTNDGSLVAKVSTDDGNSWGTEFTILDNAVTGCDERDPGLVKLASGRLCLVNGKIFVTGGGIKISNQPKFYYSDDLGLTWSAGVSMATGLFGGTSGTTFGLVYGSDVVELHNGDLLCVGYGSKSSGSNTQFDLFCMKSTDGGANWSLLNYPVVYATHGANAVEPQIAILGTGKLILTYHVENGPPQDGYIRTSTDSGATWSAPTLITTTSNRHGLSVMDDGQTVIISYVTSYGAQSFSYIESRNYGASWRTEVQIDSMAADSLYGLWAMSASLSGIGNQQNVGFIYNGENVSQTQASVFYRQFSGMDGVFVYPRAASDSWAWSDAAAVTNRTYGKTTTDSWAWSDAATKTQAFTRTGYSDPFSGAYPETWLWSDAALLSSFTFSKALSATSTSVSTSVKEVRKNLSLAATGTVSYVKRSTKAINTTVASTPSVVKSVGKTLSTAVASGIATLDTLQLTDLFYQSLNATSNVTATVVKSVATSFSVTASTTLTFVKQAGKPLSTASTPVVSFVKSARKVINVTATATVTKIASVTKTLLVTVSKTVTISAPRLVARALSVTSTATANVVRRVGVVRTVTSSHTATFTKRVSLILTNTTTVVSTFVLGQTLFRTLSATSVTVVSLTKQVGKSLNITASNSATSIKRAGVNLVESVISSPAITRGVGKALSVASAVSAEISLASASAGTVTLIAQSTTTATMVAARVKFLIVTSSIVTTMTRRGQKTLFAGSSVIARTLSFIKGGTRGHRHRGYGGSKGTRSRGHNRGTRGTGQ